MAIVALVWHGRLVPGRGEVRLVRLGNVRDVKRLEGWERERERRAGKMERGEKGGKCNSMFLLHVHIFH